MVNNLSFAFSFKTKIFKQNLPALNSQTKFFYVLINSGHF